MSGELEDAIIRQEIEGIESKKHVEKKRPSKDFARSGMLNIGSLLNDLNLSTEMLQRSGDFNYAQATGKASESKSRVLADLGTREYKKRCGVRNLKLLENKNREIQRALVSKSAVRREMTKPDQVASASRLAMPRSTASKASGKRK